MLTTQLRSAKELQGYTIHATDGDIGRVDEFYFDDESWVIRYLVADIGHWLPGRKVLISPFTFEEPDWQNKLFLVRLSREDVKNSPDIDTKKPVSRQEEIALSEHFQWTPYWTLATTESRIVKEKRKGDPHLRNTRDVLGYRIHAKDGDIGHIEDFIVNDGDWAIHHLVVDTRNWLPGKKMLVSPWWTDEINFSLPVHRRYADELYNYYQKPAYWI